jgi:hypothetical protein
MDPYEVLGVADGASAEDVRRAYLRLAREHHPDYYVDAPPAERLAAEQRMRVINEAWALVRDPDRRRALEDERPRPFRPFDADADDPDPRDAPDIPYRPAPPLTSRRRLLIMAPVLALGTSVLAAIVGTFMSIPGILGVGVLLFLLSCVGFVVMPLLALTRARRDEG